MFSKDSRNITAAASNNTNHGLQPDIISYWYFSISVMVWFTTPLLFNIWCFGLIRHWKDYEAKRVPLALLPIVIVFQALAVYVLSALTVYVFLPLSEIFLGFRNVFCHEEYKQDGWRGSEGWWTDDPLALMPAFKLFEQFGEAIPQLAIALVFYSKNYHLLSSDELMFGIATMSLSSGSVLIGVVMGLRVVPECKNFMKVSFEHDDGRLG